MEEKKELDESITEENKNQDETIEVQEESENRKEEDFLEESSDDKEEASSIEKNNVEEKTSKKNHLKIIIILIFVICVIIGIIFFFLVRGKDKEDKKELDTNSNSISNSNSNVEVDYQEVINQYGIKLEELVLNYYNQNGKTPDLATMLEYAKVGDYKISCQEQKITTDKKIYLGECRVNDSSETYSYGAKESENPEGETLTIYKGQSPNYASVVYLFSIDDDERKYFKEIATVPCKNDKCKGWVAFEQYAIVDEEDYLYVYDYVNKKYLDVKFGEDTFEFLSHEEKLYGIYYEKNNKGYLYSINAEKTFEVKGSYYEIMGRTPDVMLPLGYAPLTTEDEKTYFVNLNTGKTDFSMNQVSAFELDAKTNKVYILTYREENKANEEKNYLLKIHDSKGNSLFNGEEFDSFYVENGTFVTTKEGVYRVYNSNYQNTYTSKKHSDILSIWNEFILVVDGTNLNLMNYKEEVLTTFLTDWSGEKYYYHSMLSGWYTENGKNGIYLVIEGGDVSKNEILKNNPDMTLEELDNYDLGYEYYYIPTTKETGKIPTYIGGYAKPVLYLYPMFPTLVNVTFKHPEYLTTTYPKYKDNWTVFAKPNGDLRDLNNKYYYGLYWEESLNHRVDFKEGFYVTKENAIEFLEEKLSIIGLNDKERNEFIMYWLPVLEKNEKSLVYFELTEERDSYSPIKISPKPNSMLRMAIHVKKVNQEVKMKEQKLPTFKRQGFTVVEWGGVTY